MNNSYDKLSFRIFCKEALEVMEISSSLDEQDRTEMLNEWYMSYKEQLPYFDDVKVWCRSFFAEPLRDQGICWLKEK